MSAFQAKRLPAQAVAAASTRPSKFASTTTKRANLSSIASVASVSGEKSSVPLSKATASAKRRDTSISAPSHTIATNMEENVHTASVCSLTECITPKKSTHRPKSLREQKKAKRRERMASVPVDVVATVISDAPCISDPVYEPANKKIPLWKRLENGQRMSADAPPFAPQHVPKPSSGNIGAQQTKISDPFGISRVDEHLSARLWKSIELFAIASQELQSVYVGDLLAHANPKNPCSRVRPFVTQPWLVTVCKAFDMVLHTCLCRLHIPYVVEEWKRTRQDSLFATEPFATFKAR